MSWQISDGYDVLKDVHRITLYSTVSGKHLRHGNRPRFFLHLDMNCFYAQVEQQCFDLYGMPLIVGGWRKADGVLKGIVATASYEGRKLGIRTGMSALDAQKLCPYVICMQVHYEKYQSISAQIRRILDRFSPSVESYSMDEYFLDLGAASRWDEPGLRALASQVKNEIYRCTNLRCSVGVALTKTYAKLASSMHKPDGLTLLVDPQRILEATDQLPLSEVWGIGGRRMARLAASGIKTIGTARSMGPAPFIKLFGSYFGRLLWEVATGRDVGGVVEELVHRPKELSYLHTFPRPSGSRDAVMNELLKAVSKVAYRMRGYRAYASHFVGYLRFQDASWNGVQFRFSAGQPTNMDDLINAGMRGRARMLVTKVLTQGHKLRGVGLSTLGLTYNKQGNLFERNTELMGNLYVAVDRLNNRFGFNTIYKASHRLDVSGQTHFVERS